MLSSFTPVHLCFVFDHPQRPGLELVRLRKLAEVSENVQNRLLHDLFGIIPVPQYGIREDESTALIRPDQLMKQIDLACKDSLDQQRFRWHILRLLLLHMLDDHEPLEKTIREERDGYNDLRNPVSCD